jgi:hypothetical protein
MNIEVVRESEDRLSRKRWTFGVFIDCNSICALLGRYSEQSRKTKRHAYRETGLYSRIGRVSDSTIPAEIVTLPDDVEHEVSQAMECRTSVRISLRGEEK